MSRVLLERDISQRVFRRVKLFTFPQQLIIVISRVPYFWKLCAVRVLFSCIRDRLNCNALKRKTFLTVAANMLSQL